MTMRDFLAQAEPYRGRLTLVSLLATVGSFATLTVPWLAANLMSGVLTKNAEKFELLVPLLVAALVTIFSLSIVTSIISSQVSARILADLRCRVFEHITRLPMKFHDRSQKGDLLALMSYEVARLSEFLANTLTQTPSLIVTAAGSIILLFWIDPALALLVPVCIPLFFVALKVAGRRLRGLGEQVQKAEASVLESAEENIEMISAIKAFSREELQRDHYALRVEEARSLAVREAHIYAILAPLINMIGAMAAVALLLLAGRGVQSGAMSTSELFTFLFYSALLIRPVGSLAHLYGQFRTASGTLRRMQRVFEHPLEHGYDAQGMLPDVRGAITFQDVCFAYPDRVKTLDRVSFAIRPGEIVALIGENGAGKSTIVNLFLGYYLPESGQISLDGQNISEIQVQALRQQIGYVPQRPMLFNGTIGDNIAYGLEGASRTQIEQAARLSQAYEFIVGLPEKFETIVGDHGVRLSGGQRQRIALARALVKDPPILILDEATSMFDLEGEAALVEVCKVAFVGRTVVLITHRPESLKLASRIIDIADGGTYDRDSLSPFSNSADVSV